MALRGLGRIMKPTAQLVFRTTNVGHHNCQKDSKPLRSRREAWERLTTGEAAGGAKDGRRPMPHPSARWRPGLGRAPAPWATVAWGLAPRLAAERATPDRSCLFFFSAATSSSTSPSSPCLHLLLPLLLPLLRFVFSSRPPGKDIFEWKPPQRGKNHGVDMFKDKYNWRGPPMFEVQWAETAARIAALSARFTVLNVSFLDARADGHVATSMRYSPTTGRFGAKWKTEFPLDCLHYCYPGPTDYWALALYNLVMNNPRFAKPQTVQ